MKINDISEVKILLQEERLTEHGYENVELKRDWDKKHGDKVSMLCNGQPEEECFLIIGVEDNGLLAGKNEGWLTSTLETVSQHFNQYLDPSIALLDITTEDVLGSKVIICIIKNPGVVVKWQNNAFSGNGTTKKKLAPEEILELSLSLPGLVDITKKSASYIPNQLLIEKFCSMGNLTYDNYTLDRLHLKNTRCGELLFGDTKYRFVTYDENNNVISNETRLGLINLLSETTSDNIRQYYQNYLPNVNKITEDMLREAIGNCVGHAAFKENDGEIIIELYPNRIVFSNLSYIEYTSLANKWFSSAHKSPNPFLMETLRLAKKVDELGRGKKKLFSECLINGFHAPIVTISDAGRYKRWSLLIAFEDSPERYDTLRQLLKEEYQGNIEKSLIAYALVLWNKKPFSEIKNYFDTHESKIAAEIISDFKGPVFYWKEEDKIILHRWVKVLLEEGRASKGFTVHEEEELYKRCKELHVKYHNSFITTAQLREISHLSTSPSDRNLSSRVLTKWTKEGKLRKIKKGTYKFLNTKQEGLGNLELKSLLDAFAK